MENGDVFGLTQFVGWTINGRQMYGCRGMGCTYNAFWRGFSKWSPIHERDDWPWSYFAFNEADEIDFKARWGDHIYVDNYLAENGFPPCDELIPHNLPARPEEEILENILSQEINKEINRSLIETICANARTD